MKSVIQDNKVCYLCGTPHSLEEHHIFNGYANRKKAEADGMKVYLCFSCHRLVHDFYDNELILKKVGQRKWEEIYGDRHKFIKRYGRNYLC